MSHEEYQDFVSESPFAFGAVKLVADTTSHHWQGGLFIDGIGSLHQSGGGVATLACAMEYAEKQGCAFLVCLAAVDEVGWWAEPQASESLSPNPKR